MEGAIACRNFDPDIFYDDLCRLGVFCIGRKAMTPSEREQILQIARQMFVDESKRGNILVRAALNGAYDNGTYIQQYMDAATTEFLRRREETHDE